MEIKICDEVIITIPNDNLKSWSQDKKSRIYTFVTNKGKVYKYDYNNKSFYLDCDLELKE